MLDCNSDKTIGFVRKVDKSGRFCLPSDFRKFFFNENDVVAGKQAVSIVCLSDRIIISPYQEDMSPSNAMVVRKLDSIGRVSIPKTWRESLGLINHKGDILIPNIEVRVIDTGIVIKPYHENLKRTVVE